MSKKLTNKQILEKAIEKAIKNGFEFIQSSSKGQKIQWDTFRLDGKIFSFWTNKALWQQNGLFEVIFSHDFAEAFWTINKKCWSCEKHGIKAMYVAPWKQKYCNDCGKKLKLIEFDQTEDYLYHLSEMVMKKEPLKYIEKFL